MIQDFAFASVHNPEEHLVFIVGMLELAHKAVILHTFTEGYTK
jgi:hypothetical protein